MKSSDLKVVAIILAIALFFTIVTSNAVSIASVVLLANGGGNSTASNNGGNSTGNNGDNSANNGGDNSYVPSGSNDGSANVDNPSSGDNSQSSGDNSQSSGDSNTPSGNNTQTNNNGQSSNNGSGNNSTADPNAWDKTKTFNFYKAACDKITSTGAAGHTRKEWQQINDVQLGSLSSLKDIIEGFVKTEDEAEEKVSEKGSDDAKRRMAPCGADISYVKSATKKDLSNGNYQITIVMNDENTPKKGSNGIAAMATGILYMEDVENEIANNSAIKLLVKGLEKGEIVYKNYTIVAEMTKDGKFVTIKHHTVGVIDATAKLPLNQTMSGSGELEFNSYWHDFKY